MDENTLREEIRSRLQQHQSHFRIMRDLKDQGADIAQVRDILAEVSGKLPTHDQPSPMAPPGPQGVPYHMPVRPQFVPLRRLAWMLTALLLLIVGLEVYGIALDQDERDLIQRLERRDWTVTTAELGESDDRQMNQDAAVLGIQVVMVITLIVWLRRCRKNLDAFGAVGMQYALHWAWLGFIVPFLNLWRPYQVAQETWKASTITGDSANPYFWQGLPGNGVIQIWWAVLLISNGLRRAVNSLDTATLSGLATYNGWSHVVRLVAMVAALVTLTFVWDLTNRQHAKHEHLLAGPLSVAPSGEIAVGSAEDGMRSTI